MIECIWKENLLTLSPPPLLVHFPRAGHYVLVQLLNTVVMALIIVSKTVNSAWKTKYTGTPRVAGASNVWLSSPHTPPKRCQGAADVGMMRANV